MLLDLLLSETLVGAYVFVYVKNLECKNEDVVAFWQYWRKASIW